MDLSFITDCMHSNQCQLRAIPRHEDIVANCADAVITHYVDTLPDLRSAVILMPRQLQQRQLRQHLLKKAQEHGYTALLPPAIETLSTLFRKRMPHHPKLLSEHECKLLLATMLDQHPDVLPHVSRWELAEQLLQLFDNIAATHPQNQPPELNASPATEIVQPLYNIWREGLQQTPDVKTLYRHSLQEDNLTTPDEHIFLCGLGELSPCESEWANKLYQDGRLTLITHAGESGRYITASIKTAETIIGKPMPQVQSDNALTRLLDASFADDKSIHDRAHALNAQLANSPAVGRISVFKPESLEQHAVGICLKVHDWLEAGLSPIAIISQDRKLSRRLRAVLERADIPLRDHAGWALSTTASATAITSLIPSEAQNFTADIILTLARSPYCKYYIDVMRTQRACAYLERMFAKIEPFKDLDETIDVLCAANAKDATANEVANKDAQMIVARIDTAISSLRKLATSKQQPLAKLFDTLFEAMDALGMITTLQKDDAGEILLKELEAMAMATRAQNSTGNWNLWRGWMLHTFERKYFTPKEHNYLVELYSLPQSILARPAGLVIAALDTSHTIPTDPTHLLNEDERRALDLKGRNWRIATHFELFRTALESTDHVLLTFQHSDNTKILTPAPWLDGLQHFHKITYGDDLEEKHLKLRAQAEIRTTTGTFKYSTTKPQMPKPSLPVFPKDLSVSDLQTAVVCPYRFFAKKSLQLAPAPEADNYDSARSYGLHLHRCLTALHSDLEDLPGPMDKPWIEENRQHALALAHDIISAVFAPSLEHHYSAVERKQKTLEAAHWYVDWLIKNTAPDAQFEAETPRGGEIQNGLQLHGRADCVIHEKGGTHILDYKSNCKSSKKKDMISGEDIQLTAYALFSNPVKSVSYMNMKQCKPITLAGEALNEACEELQKRLVSFKKDAKDSPLPAWAKDEDCQYCDYFGLCRRRAWRYTHKQQQT